MRGVVVLLLVNSNCLSSTESFHLHEKPLYAVLLQVAPNNKQIRFILQGHEILFLVPPSHLELVNTKPVLTLNAGSVRAMSCRARNARPQAKIVWYMGDNKILDQGQININSAGSSPGSYLCFENSHCPRVWGRYG